MPEQKQATALIPSAPTDERRLPNQKYVDSISSPMPDYKPRAAEPLATMDGRRLLLSDLPPIQFIVEGILPQGLYILAGSPKVGKSWLALHLLCQVACGGSLWGRKATQGTALYLALEDSLPRLQARYKRYDEVGSASLHFAVRARTLRDGLVEQVMDFIAIHPDTRLVVIDTMQHIRGSATDKNPYVNDYVDMDILRQITAAHDIALLLVTHTRKLDDTDPLNRISGSTGLVGAVDGVCILEKEERTSNKGRLTVANRDTEGYVFRLEFDADACLWCLLEEELAPQREDPLFPFLVALMADRRQWRGTATELCALAEEYGAGGSFTPATVAKRLRANEQVLLNKYCIGAECSTKNNVKTILLANKAQG